MPGDRQASAVWAESMRATSAEFVSESWFPVGNPPHAQRVPFAKADQEAFVGTEEQVFPQNRSRDDAPDLLVVGDTADTDDPFCIVAGVEAVLPTVRHRGRARGRRAPARHAADVGQGQRGDGLVAQPLIGSKASGLAQGSKTIEPLAHLSAKAAGASPIPQGLEQLVLGIALIPLGHRQRGLSLFRLMLGGALRV